MTGFAARAMQQRLNKGRATKVDATTSAILVMGLEMGDVTRSLTAIERGERRSSEELLPLVYDELRKLAAQRLSHESPDHTLQPTALVHEAYMRLVDVQRAPHWKSRGHFFGAAAQAMRRILVEAARSKGRVKRGGGHCRVSWRTRTRIS